MNTCAVCGSVITVGGLCNAHWYEYTCTGSVMPAWLDYLISSHRSFEKNYASWEIVFSDLAKPMW